MGDHRVVVGHTDILRYEYDTIR